MSEFLTLAGTLDAAWAVFEDGARDADAPGRTLAVASVGGDGGAEVRMMVLRAASRTEARLEVQSDAAAGKVAEFAQAPRGSVLAWDAARGFQVRARVKAAVTAGDPAAWAKIPEVVRARYGGTRPGTVLSAPEDATGGPEQARFAVIALTVDEIETLYLGDPHRRAAFRAADGFAGRWIAP